MLKYLHVILTFIIHTYGASLSANHLISDNYTFVHLSMASGLQHRFVDDIYKDSRGFLWLSTAGGGISRYDGYEYLSFNTKNTQLMLKSNFVKNAVEDRFGRLWIATERGIALLDLNTYKFLNLSHLGEELLRISNTQLVRVYVDTQGAVWVFGEETLFRIELDLLGNLKSLATLPQIPMFIHDFPMVDIEENGSIWIAHGGSLSRVRSSEHGALNLEQITPDPIFSPGVFVSAMHLIDRDLWIGTNAGLYRYALDTESMLVYLHDEKDANSLSQDYVTDLTSFEDGKLMIGTLQGVSIFDEENNLFLRIGLHDANGINLLSCNFVNSLLVDGQRIWVGTETGGLNKIEPRGIELKNFVHIPGDAATLPKNPVNALCEDAKGDLWIGVVERGLSVKRKGDDKFTLYNKEMGVLTHNSVSALTVDADNNLWVGTWGGGIDVLDIRKKPKSILHFDSENSAGTTLDFIGALAYDSINNGVWIGANHGVFYYDLDQKQLLSPFANGSANRLRGSLGMMIDRDNQLWIGTLYGVYIVDLASRLDQVFFYKQPALGMSLSDECLLDKITALCEHSDGTIYIGTNGNGLFRMLQSDSGAWHYQRASGDDGGMDNCIRGILEDSEGCLWISTNNGLTFYNIETDNFVHLKKEDGLHSELFYWNASCKMSDGFLYFGTASGLVQTSGGDLSRVVSSQDIRFTRLMVGNQVISAGDNRYINEDISVATLLKLHEKDKSFSVEFSAMNFESLNNNRYQYRLVGFDEEWIEVPNGVRFVSYTNLPAGKYRLLVKTTSDMEAIESSMQGLDIVIESYFYKSKWFIACVLLLLFLLVYQLYKYRVRFFKVQRQMLNQIVYERTAELEKQKTLFEVKSNELLIQNETLLTQNERISRQKEQLLQLSRQIQELTTDKLSFFTNITHEFRTPLTLIVGPIDKAMRLTNDHRVMEQLQFADKNSKYLLSLINQLMDFRKVENEKMHILPTECNVAVFMDHLLTPFKVFAAERGIEICLYSRLNGFNVLLDQDAMYKVVSNLLSNAIKFTPDNGRISIYIAQLHNRKTQNQELLLSVSDSGIGIPDTDLLKIFEQFYQSSNRINYPVYGQSGTGIGLYLCRQIVRILRGEIIASNNKNGMGACFRMRIPLSLPSLEIEMEPCVEDQLMISDEAQLSELQIPVDLVADTVVTNKVLVVEDNQDMRNYIASILANHYQVVLTSNGEEALAYLLNHQDIDFILCDLMMPIMDGKQFSMKVKTNLALSHIPILILTAKNSDEERKQSYQIGVDGYLLKPFDEEMLLARIKGILTMRRKYQQRFSVDLEVEALQLEESADKRFVNKAIDIVKQNFRDPLFDVATFSVEMGVSKSLLNKKLQSLTGQSIGNFVRNYRLKLAYEMILMNKESRIMNISDIAYGVGFNDPKYFTRCFCKEFGTTPSALIQHKESTPIA